MKKVIIRSIIIVMLIIIAWDAFKKYPTFIAQRSWEQKYDRDIIIYEGTKYYELPWNEISSTNYTFGTIKGKVLEPLVGALFSFYIYANHWGTIQNDPEQNFMVELRFREQILYCKEEILNQLYPNGIVDDNITEEEDDSENIKKLDFSYGSVTAIKLSYLSEAFITKQDDIDFLCSLEKIKGTERYVKIDGSASTSYDFAYCYNDLPIYETKGCIAIVDDRYVYVSQDKQEDGDIDYYKGVLIEDKKIIERLEKIEVDGQRVFSRNIEVQ